MFGFSAGEILLIALIALILFGNEKLPQNIKKFLKGWNQTKKVAFDMQKSWHEIKHDLKDNLEIFEDKNNLLVENAGKADTKLPAQPSIKPAHSIVCQDEIDGYQLEFTHSAGQIPEHLIQEQEKKKDLLSH